jgi:hypothetical protein
MGCASTRVTVKGHCVRYAEIGAYEMVFRHEGRETRQLVLNVRMLDYADEDNVRLLLAVSDVTDSRIISEKLKEDLLREKATLLQELQTSGRTQSSDHRNALAKQLHGHVRVVDKDPGTESQQPASPDCAPQPPSRE